MARNWVLLRGLIRESRHWEGFDRAMQATFSQDRVEALDLPGNGSLCTMRSPDSIEEMVAALRQQLSAQGMTPPFHVVALSLGAMTAISWLSDYPGEVAAATLINTSVARFSPAWRRLRYQNYGRVARALLTSQRQTREEIILSITSNRLDPAARQELARRWAGYARERPVSRANALRQLWAAARFHAPETLPDGVPVQLLNGGGDRLVSPSCSRDLASGWGVPLEIHPQAGHDLTLDDSDWAIERIRRWAATL